MIDVNERMREIVENVRKSRTEEYPPIYEFDDSRYRNCYAHALNISVEDRLKRGIFHPGKISVYAGKKDVKVIDMPFWDSYEANEIISAVISDCEVLGIKAEVADIDEPAKEGAYKIFICEDGITDVWHFVRESVAEDGKRILTHKESGLLPTCQVRKSHHCIINSSRFFIKAALELSPLENNKKSDR